MADKKLSASERMKARRDSQLKDYKKVFSTEQGKRVLYDLIANHYVMSSTYVHGERESDLAFREGQRQVVLRIMTVMKFEPSQVADMIKESDAYVREI